MNIIVYSVDGSYTEENVEFDVELAQTILVELEYWNDGTDSGINVSYEEPAGSSLQPLIKFNSLDTLVNGQAGRRNRNFS